MDIIFYPYARRAMRIDVISMVAEDHVIEENVFIEKQITVQPKSLPWKHVIVKQENNKASIINGLSWNYMGEIINLGFL